MIKRDDITVKESETLTTGFCKIRSNRTITGHLKLTYKIVNNYPKGLLDDTQSIDGRYCMECKTMAWSFLAFFSWSRRRCIESFDRNLNCRGLHSDRRSFLHKNFPSQLFLGIFLGTTIIGKSSCFNPSRLCDNLRQSTMKSVSCIKPLRIL